MQQLAGELAGRAHVDQRLARLLVLEHFVAEGPNRQVGILGHVVGARILRLGLARPGASVELPALAAAVHDAAVGVAVEFEDPKRIAGPPVVLVAVEDDGRVVGDALARAELGKAVFVDVVADDLVLQIGVPVDLAPRRARAPADRAARLRRDSTMRTVGIVLMLVDPGGAHQDFFVGVLFGHISNASRVPEELVTR